MTYVALLRGINVGGKNAVSMAKLKSSFEKLGFDNVKTYINSGNVIFTTPTTPPRKLESVIETALARAFGFPIRVLIRDLREMERVVKSLPKQWKGSTALRCNVIFLGHPIDKPSIVRSLRAKEGVDSVMYRKGALFWSVPFKDVARSGMTRIVGDGIYKEMTIRNQNTTRRIYELMKTAVSADLPG
jgi:uncharacterized protein (DUF1697 family)